MGTSVAPHPAKPQSGGLEKGSKRDEVPAPNNSQPAPHSHEGDACSLHPSHGGAPSCRGPVTMPKPGGLVSLQMPGPMLSHLKNLIKNIPKRRPPAVDRSLYLHSPRPCKEPGALQSQEEGGNRSMSWASARSCLIQGWLRGRATCTRGSRLCCRHLGILAISSRIKWHFTRSRKGQWSMHGARRTRHVEDSELGS